MIINLPIAVFTKSLKDELKAFIHVCLVKDATIPSGAIPTNKCKLTADQEGENNLIG